MFWTFDFHGEGTITTKSFCIILNSFAISINQEEVQSIILRLGKA